MSGDLKEDIKVMREIMKSAFEKTGGKGPMPSGVKDEFSKLFNAATLFGTTKALTKTTETADSPLAEAEKKSPGLKFDTGKPPLELLSPRYLEGTAKVLGFGAQKYAAWNWSKGIHYSRLIGGILRHVTAFQAGEDIDPESGLPHLYHASCGLMFLTEMQHLHPELDDRFKTKGEPYERP